MKKKLWKEDREKYFEEIEDSDLKAKTMFIRNLLDYIELRKNN